MSIRFIVIDGPIKHWNHPIVKQLFHKIIDIKVRGFKARFPSNYLAVDTIDYVGTHVLACKEVNKEFVPIMAFKGITKRVSDHYALPFPGRNCIASTNSIEHKDALEKFIENCEGKNEEIAYTCSFTIEPKLENRRDRFEAMKYLYPLLLFYHYAMDVDKSIAIGSTKTKTNHMFKKLGFVGLSNRGVELPTIKIPSLMNEEFLVVLLEKFSQNCMDMAHDCMDKWNNRIEVSDKVMCHTKFHSGKMSHLNEHKLACLQ